MLNQSYFHTMKFSLRDYDLGDLGLGDFNLGDFDLIPIFNISALAGILL